jgi:hypothetical protein
LRGLPFPKHSRLARLDTLGFDAPYFGYTLGKLTHRVDLPSFTPPSKMEAMKLYLPTLLTKDNRNMMFNDGF